ncbi:MAG: hypothetical protein WA869_04680 [Alloacidobacterium sp.]
MGGLVSERKLPHAEPAMLDFRLQAEALIQPVGEGTGAMPNYRRGSVPRAIGI